MKKDFLTYSTGVYEIPVHVTKSQVDSVVEDLKQLDSFVRVEIQGLHDKYTVTAMLKDIRDVAWFKLKWI